MRRLTKEEPETEPRGILELFPEEEPADETRHSRASLTTPSSSVLSAL